MKAQRCCGFTLAPSLRSAFSLIEVLLAIFILGIGVISIAALFPAGIAQQRLTNDDVMGPIVANQAMSLLRSRVTPDDFGTFWDFGIELGDIGYADTPNDRRPTIVGDWPWIRPAVITSRSIPDLDIIYPNPPVPPGTNVDTRGALDIFSYYAYWQGTGGSFDSPIKNLTEFPHGGGHPLSSIPLYGVPFNTTKYPPPSALGTSDTYPRVLILQNERFYPMSPHTYVPPGDSNYPQYAWDCMFRRFEGKILVAVFVYRVTLAGGRSANNFHVSPPPVGFDQQPSIPWRRNLLAGFSPTGGGASGAWSFGGADKDHSTLDDNNFVVGTPNGTPYNPLDWNSAWQEPRQWMLDTNNNIHRVLSLQRVSGGQLPGNDPSQGSSGDVWVELARPISPVRGTRNTLPMPLPTLVPHFYRDDPEDPPFPSAIPNGSREWMAEKNVVTDIWYVPLQMGVDLNGDGTPDTTANLTPVYVTVQEL